ncbi:hypothetical protein CCP3SC1_1200008 [Gammaproteobacteria bacterium]
MLNNIDGIGGLLQTTASISSASSNYSGSGDEATVTIDTVTPHGLVTEHRVTVYGLTPVPPSIPNPPNTGSDPNGYHSIIVTSTTQFTYVIKSQISVASYSGSGEFYRQQNPVGYASTGAATLYDSTTQNGPTINGTKPGNGAFITMYGGVNVNATNLYGAFWGCGLFLGNFNLGGVQAQNLGQQTINVTNVVFVGVNVGCFRAAGYAFSDLGFTNWQNDQGNPITDINVVNYNLFINGDTRSAENPSIWGRSTLTNIGWTPPGGSSAQYGIYLSYISYFVFLGARNFPTSKTVVYITGTSVGNVFDSCVFGNGAIFLSSDTSFNQINNTKGSTVTDNSSLNRVSNVVVGGVNTSLYLATSQTIPNNTETVVTWSGERYSGGFGIWSAGTPTRVNVPSGARRVRVSAGTSWDASSDGQFVARIRSNSGANWAKDNRYGTASNGSGSATLITPIIDVSSITYFELYLIQVTGGNLDLLATNATYLTLEVL